MFGSPTLEPLDYLLTLQAGDDGWACLVKGNVDLFAPADITEGYTDGQYIF